MATAPPFDEFRAVVERSATPTLMFDLRDQRVRVANTAFSDLIGLSHAAIVGLSPAQVFEGADGLRARTALAGLTDGDFDSFHAKRQLRTGRGAVAVTEWVRRIQVSDGPVAVATMVAATETKSSDSSSGSEVRARPDADRISRLEEHLLQFASELHAGRWLQHIPLAVDASRIQALDALTERQRQIVDRLLLGERIPSIARAMFVSASTVRNHLSHVFAAFRVHGQSELLALLRSSSSETTCPGNGH